MQISLVTVALERENDLLLARQRARQIKRANDQGRHHHPLDQIHDGKQLMQHETTGHTMSETMRAKRLALFDLDHTLIPMDSDHAWGDFTIARGWVDPVEFKQNVSTTNP